MKPPSQDAITKALGILLDSIQEENGMTFTSSYTHPSSVIPFEQLAVNADALRLARSCLETELCHVQGCHNMAVPIHRVPAEVFEVILKMTKLPRGVHSIRSLLSLMRVCRRWHDTILSSPQLWIYVDSSLPSEWARMVMERSKDLPILSFDWDLAYFRDVAGDYEEILEMAVQNSTRFKSMDILISHDHPFDMRPLLESRTTALTSLTITVDKHSRYSEFDFKPWTLVLSDGPPLKNLVLRDMPLNFDCSRLSRLVTLHLSKSAVPASLKTLIQVLSATSAHLEHLTIGAPKRLEDDHQPYSPITFPRLTELKIYQMMPLPSTKLVASIYAPACSRTHVSELPDVPCDIAAELDAVIWKPGNPQMVAFLGLSSGWESRVSQITIEAGGPGAGIRIREEDDERRSFRCRRDQLWKLVKLMWEFLLYFPSSFAIGLSFRDYTFQDDPLDLMVWNGRIAALDLSDYATCRSALEQLGQRVAVPSCKETRTRDDWMYPNLLSIRLRIPETKDERAAHLAALLSLVQRRWSSADTGLALPPSLPNSRSFALLQATRSC